MGWTLSFWLSSEDKNLHQGVTLQVELMQLPLPEKFDMIWCTWTDGCRRRSVPQTSNQSKSASLDKYMGWILSFWPSSEDKNSHQSVTLQVGLMQLPLPEKFDMIWCTWTDGCRRRSGPQTSNQSRSTSLDEYMGWILSFWLLSEDKNLPQGVTFQAGLMQLPLPEKFDMIWCTWTDGCRRRSRPQTSNQSRSASLDRYMGWILSFWLSSEGKNSPQGVTF